MHIKAVLECHVEEIYQGITKKFVFKKELILRRKPRIGGSIQTYINLPQNRRENCLVTVISQTASEDGEKLLCQINLPNDLVRQHFLLATLFPDFCDWEIKQ